MKVEGNQNIIDIHSHILPGLDDGAKDWEQSCHMLSIAWEQGIRKIIATPHFMPEQRGPASQTVAECANRLQAYADELGYGMEIYTGSEIYYHEEVPELLENGSILTLADSSYVLVEFSPMDDFRYIRNSLNEIQTMGFDPIIAHVERYENVFKKPFGKIKELKDMGCRIQVNASTVEGKMGRKIQKGVITLCKLGLVDFIGTDAHSAGNRAPCISKCSTILYKKCPKDYVDRLLFKNAEELILKK